MKLKLFPLALAAVATSLPLTVLAQAQVTFEIFASFDYPGALGSNLGGINEAGDVVGGYTDNTFFSHGFVRFHDGTFSAPIIDPNDDGDSTNLWGINGAKTICGSYGTGNLDDPFQAFLLSDLNTFTEFDLPGAAQTLVKGINDAGNLCGIFWNDLTHPSGAWVSIDGTISTFYFPARDTSLNGINNLNQCVGAYVDRNHYGHGLARNADGTLHYPIDVHGESSTYLFGINDRGQMVGLTEGDGTHGVFFSDFYNSAKFDYPGANNYTVFTGINSHGLIAGFWRDSFGFTHSFIVRVRFVTN